MSKDEQPRPQPHGDLDYYFKLRRGEVEPRYKVKTREEELAEFRESLAQSVPNRSIQFYDGRCVYVPNGMAAAEIVEGALVLEREFEVDRFTAELMVEQVLKAINRLRVGSDRAGTPQGQGSA